MAKTSLKVKQARKPKYSTRAYTRCRLCGRPHSVLRKYGICRVCFREMAYKGEIPGVKKASWQAVDTEKESKAVGCAFIGARSFCAICEIRSVSGTGCTYRTEHPLGTAVI